MPAEGSTTTVTAPVSASGRAGAESAASATAKDFGSAGSTASTKEASQWRVKLSSFLAGVALTSVVGTYP